MKIIRQQEQSINKTAKLVAESLLAGQVIAYPTETVYGLGCDATNRQAVERIYAIKQREAGKPMLVLVSSLKMASEFLEVSKLAKRLAKEYWPGPLTIVLKVKEQMRESLGRETVGVRVSSHPLALAIVKKIKRPLISTSANLSGQEPAVSMEDVVSYFSGDGPGPDMLIDGGQLAEAMPSTILDLSGDVPKVLREGSVVIDLERLK
jgi:L-threonylcarbamoyladenylate synthase